MFNFSSVLTKPLRLFSVSQMQQCRNVFGLHKLIEQKKPSNIKVSVIPKEEQAYVVELIKEFFLPEHVFVKDRRMNVRDDQALDEYLMKLLKQGNSLYATTKGGDVAGLCVNFASSPVDPRNLRNFAYYRQDPNIKNLFNFIAKLEETPNFWNVFEQQKIFEIKMMTVLPEFRRQGISVWLTEKSIALALDQGYGVVRMNCINDYDYKIAERCMMQCIARFPLHKLRSTTAPFIKKSSEYNKIIRVYVDVKTKKEESPGDKRRKLSKPMQICQNNLDECLQ